MKWSMKGRTSKLEAFAEGSLAARDRRGSASARWQPLRGGVQLEFALASGSGPARPTLALTCQAA